MHNLPHPSTSEFANRHSKVTLAQRVFKVMNSPSATLCPAFHSMVTQLSLTCNGQPTGRKGMWPSYAEKSVIYLQCKAKQLHSFKEPDISHPAFPPNPTACIYWHQRRFFSLQKAALAATWAHCVHEVFLCFFLWQEHLSWGELEPGDTGMLVLTLLYHTEHFPPSLDFFVWNIKWLA